VATSAPPAAATPDARRVMWRRLALVTLVGVCVAGAGAAYLSIRSTRPHPARGGPDVVLSVSCPTASFCMSVDDQGNAIELEGGTWSRPRSLQKTGLNRVSCPTETFCVAVGVGGDASVLRGTRWAQATSVDSKSAGEADNYGTSGLSAVSCVSPSFCMAGDVLGRVSIFNGARWQRPRRMESRAQYETDRHAGTAGISSLSCVAPTMCVAVTVAGHALTFDGKTWSNPVALESAQSVDLDRFLSVPALAAVSCGSTSFCAAVDPGGNVWTFDGTAWSAPDPVDPLGASGGDADGLTAISCPTALHCVAVDGRGDAITYDDGSWSSATSVDPILGLTDISCAESSFCVALNDLGQGAAYDGHVWTTVKDIDRR
jgi:hypothetical protein